MKDNIDKINELNFDDFMGYSVGHTWNELEEQFKEEYSTEEISTIKHKWIKRYEKLCEERHIVQIDNFTNNN